MPTREEVDAFDAPEKIEYLSATGNQLKLGMLLTGQASVREHATWIALDVDALANLTLEEVDSRLRDVAAVCLEHLLRRPGTPQSVVMSDLFGHTLSLWPWSFCVATPSPMATPYPCGHSRSM